MSEFEVLNQAFKVRLSPASCSVDLGDGSERGEYVNQDYILRLMGRPHRGINLMYCYYPYDKGWPARASAAHKATGSGAWDFPYDDYFPYLGGPKGSSAGEPFRQIRDIRRHGQDATLTLTMDCAVKDDEIAFIAKELACFGRMRIRLNHECDGSWFSFNKRYSYREVGEFFIRFSKVLKKNAPEIRLISCFGSVDHATGRLNYEEELTPMLPYADVWSMDRYLSLHYGWPNNICEQDQLNIKYTNTRTGGMWAEMEKVYAAFCRKSGEQKPMELCELNADGDVGGPSAQRAECVTFYKRVLRERLPYLKGITYYQFRDRGRLGLEQEDPNNPEVGIRQPFLDDYLSFIRHPYFTAGQEWKPLGQEKPVMDWRSAEDSDGIGWKVRLKSRPIFFELRFPKEQNLLVCVNGRWFYKKPGTEWVDATSAVASEGAGRQVAVSAFAPPADGANPPQGNGWQTSVLTELAAMPELRARYGWKQSQKKG
jgi:hypothetical protein